MPEVEDPKHVPIENPSAPAAKAEPVRKLPRARRLLSATIGAATIQFVGGCIGGSSVANLMAAPNVPAGPGQRVDSQQGSAGFQVVANLMAPPRSPLIGVSGQTGGAGVSGQTGSAGAAGTHAGAAGTHAVDMDAGLDDHDAGEA